jgi:hypothetical protein
MNRIVGCAALFSVSLSAAGVFGPTFAIADGAIAVGVAPGGASNGYATGYGYNKPDTESARAQALGNCQKSYVASAPTSQVTSNATDRCEIVITFRNKCAAGALDPKNGTPGVGWAIGDTQKDADDEAMARCRNTAGPDRRDFCKVADRYCDGTAK